MTNVTVILTTKLMENPVRFKEKIMIEIDGEYADKFREEIVSMVHEKFFERAKNGHCNYEICDDGKEN